MSKKVISSGGINRQLSGEPGFTPEDLAKVVEIRALYRRGVRGHGYTILGLRFGVTPETIRRIIRRVLWKHVVADAA